MEAWQAWNCILPCKKLRNEAGRFRMRLYVRMTGARTEQKKVCVNVGKTSQQQKVAIALES